MFSPLQVKLRFSHLFTGLSLIVLTAAVGSVLISGLPLFSQFVLLLFLLLLAVYFLTTYLFLTAGSSVIALRWLTENRSLSIQFHDRQWDSVTVIEERFICPILVALKVKTAKRLLPVLVLVWRDSVDRQQFRRLKVLARFSPGPEISSTRSLSE